MSSTSKPQSKPARGKTPPSTGALERVHLRNEFYRDNFRTMATALPILVGALVLSVGLNFYQATRKPMERYFSIDPAGHITKMIALTEPYVSDSYLSTWVTEKVSRAYAFDPQNYRRQIGDLQPYFTPDGYTSFLQSLESSGTLKTVTENLLVVNGVPTGAPVIVDRGIANGVMFWKVQLPMKVSFRSATHEAHGDRVITVTVVRRLTLESPDGIGIANFVAADL